jgi:hypothetical protein
MGATGLLPHLLNGASPINIYKECRGMRVGIDVMTVIYRSSIRRAGEAIVAQAELRGVQPDFSYDAFAILVNLAVVQDFRDIYHRLLVHGVCPVCVIDGERLPAKANEQKRRRDARDASRTELEILMCSLAEQKAR